MGDNVTAARQRLTAATKYRSYIIGLEMATDIQTLLDDTYTRSDLEAVAYEALDKAVDICRMTARPAEITECAAEVVTRYLANREAEK